MSKKRKRQVRKAQSEAVTPSKTKGKRSRSSEREFNPDYTYVEKDLRRIGVLAGTFLVILVVLSFFLN